ncbi:VTT domain-containing protein [Janibacter cremeus]|uniref:DedA family protein n=1 Tax=Janibacter cremeus TaxID=1285192 RepID=UPI0023F62B04|nr:VTT domain-containing protein [Janibacter cremeus]WEV79592.1 VTT domain-containing protein [Janibacter cremeus]
MTWSAFLPTFGFLFVVVMLRANATYWLARGAAAGSRRYLGSGEGGPSPRWARARDLVNRWGPIAVVACFLTVGIQTAVIGAAGAARMPLRRYLPAVTLGSLLWATLYATVGLAAARAWLAAAARWPGTVAAVAVLLVITVALVVWRRGHGDPETVAALPTRTREAVPASSDDMRS